MEEAPGVIHFGEVGQDLHKLFDHNIIARRVITGDTEDLQPM